MGPMSSVITFKVSLQSLKGAVETYLRSDDDDDQK